MKRTLIISICIALAFVSVSQNHSDCNKALDICNKQSLHLIPAFGPGIDPTEMNYACFQSLNPADAELHSVWIRFTVERSGSFFFLAQPDSISDDLDFILFHLQGSQCAGKTIRRCMAAGDYSLPSPCMGSTGLLPGQTDTTGLPGCNNNSDNFLAPLEVLAGESYALVINNFNGPFGFTVDFCGTALLGCESDSCFQISTAAGSQPVVGPFKLLKIYPNPVSNELSIELAAQYGEQVELQVLSPLGKILKVERRQTMAGLSTEKIMLGDIPPGYYILTVKTRESACPAPFVKI